MVEYCIYEVKKVGTDPQLFPKMRRSWAVKSHVNLAGTSVLGREHEIWFLVRGIIGIVLLPGSKMLLLAREVLRMLNKSEVGTSWLLKAP